ncbi:MAG: ExbD/TolR family protein [Pirellulaceae bacterium]
MKLTSRKLQRGAKFELSMTSMIDVVFLLLIFFMTTTAYVKPEKHLDPAIKVSERSAASAASDLEPAIVEVRRSGDQFVFKLGVRELTSQDELTSLLRQFPNKLDGAFVRVSSEAPFRMAAAAIQACKNADFTTVSYIPWEP